MTSSFENTVVQRLDGLGLSMSELAARLTMPELELRQLCRHGDPRLSELRRVAEALHLPPRHFLNGSLNQVGNGNTQKIKVGKAAAHELAALLGSCRRALDASEALVVAKDEIIALLRGGSNQMQG